MIPKSWPGPVVDPVAELSVLGSRAAGLLVALAQAAVVEPVAVGSLAPGLRAVVAVGSLAPGLPAVAAPVGPAVGQAVAVLPVTAVFVAGPVAAEWNWIAEDPPVS